MVSIVWMVLTLVAAVLFLMVGGLCIGAVLGPVAMAAAVEPRSVKHAPGPRALAADLSPADLSRIAESTREDRARIRERNGVRHGGWKGRGDERGGLVMVDVVG